MNKDNQRVEEYKQQEKKSICGIVMPISAIDNCNENHWLEVKKILTEAIELADFEAKLVSDSDDSGIIQKRIIQNLYNNDIVVCDVSCKNPNVMFELGMRLAFDKPTIIVKDNFTQYSFDTAPIEHLEYPRDLSYYRILDFKNKLRDKIKGTMTASKRPDYTTFLKNFGEFEVSRIENKKGTIDDILLSKLDEISQQIVDIKFNQRVRRPVFVESEIDTKNIDIITRKLINQYCLDNNITEGVLYDSDENSTNRISLYKYMLRSQELMNLCNSSNRIKKAISDNLLPF